MDGTQYFCSKNLSCRNCSTHKRGNGQAEYFHTLLAASIVTPGQNRVLPLAPEFVEPQDGHDKQDCESRAIRRWLGLHAARYRRLNPVYLGDDLYSRQPPCEAVLASGGHFLFVCKPDSHKLLGEYLTGIVLPSRSQIVRHGKKRATHGWRWMENVPRRDGCDALRINWLEITIRDSSGKVTYRNSFVTNLPVNRANVAELTDQAWKAAANAAGARIRFFNNIRALTVFVLFPSWECLLKTLAFQAPPPVPP